jgi:hypothetical protein
VRHLQHEVDVDVPGDGVRDRTLDLCRRARQRRHLSSLDRPRRTPACFRGNEDEHVRLQLLEPLCDRNRAVRELLDENARAEIVVQQPLDGDSAQVEVALVEVSDPADDDPSQLRRRRC